MKSKVLVSLAGIIMSATFAAAILSGQQQLVTSRSYAVTDLGTLGGTFSVAFSINNRGWVAGSSTLPGDQEQHAFLWRGEMTDLGTLGGPNSSATFPLNESGELPGSAETSTPDPLGEEFCDFLGFMDHLICVPFVWQSGVMTTLPTLGGNNGVANEINNQGQAVGAAENALLDPSCQSPTLQMKPVLWEKGKIQGLPMLPGDLDGSAAAINDQGQAVGFSGTGVCANEFFHAVLWQNGTAADLGNLGGTTGNNPQDINNQGQVVGVSDLPSDLTSHAFLWQNDVMTDLGTLPGDFSSYAGAINNNSQVVGQSCDANFNCRAFFWENGVMTDLNTLTPADSPLYLVVAYGVNSSGQITGLGITRAGEAHAFLATPSNGSVVGAKPRLTLPENVRHFIQQRLHRGRSKAQPRAH
jgi:probable HAF family extracellular repeat protein